MTLQTTDFILLRRLTNDAFQGVDNDLNKGFYSETNEGGISEASAIFLSQAHTQLSDLRKKLGDIIEDA
jgi:hypothetical protein|tara:strand:+ start:72 stop:278 length:207 start_codon:yes stop_codon:yes gene_type:complete